MHLVVFVIRTEPDTDFNMSIDHVMSPERDKKQNGSGTLKKCPHCDAYIHISAERCIKCGTIFIFYKPELHKQGTHHGK